MTNQCAAPAMVGHFKCQHMRAGATKETPLRRLQRRLTVLSFGNVMIPLLILGRPTEKPNKNKRIGIEKKTDFTTAEKVLF